MAIPDSTCRITDLSAAERSRAKPGGAGGAYITDSIVW